MFNKEQLEAINQIDGAVIVSAPAGSGKSTLLIGRIENMIAQGINQEDILLTTFTNESANDLKNKLNDKGYDNVRVGTFHSVCRNILIQEGINIDKRPPANYIIQNKFKSLRLDDKILVKDILSWIGYQKNHCYNSSSESFAKKESEYDEYNLRAYFKAYEDLMEENKCYDFEDWLILAMQVLVQDIEGKYSVKYLMVDEFQDSNALQIKIMQLICPSRNICVVGDEKQCLLPNTKILTIDGEKEIKDITTSDTLIVASGKGTTYQHKATELLSKNYEGEILTIKTKSGKEIKCTPNHGFFVNNIINKPYMVYLMYKENVGFRIGFSKQYKESFNGGSNGFERRLVQEGGDKVWCIEVYDEQEIAKYYEQYYAFKYGIPLYPFKCANRDILLTDEGAIKLFKEVNSYEKGMKLLADLKMDFDRPHFMPNRATNKIDIGINLTIFGSERKKKTNTNGYIGYNHELSYCTTDISFEDESNYILPNISHKKNGNGISFIEGRKTSSDMDSLYNIATQLEDLRPKNLLRYTAKIVDNKKMVLYPASNIRCGMKLPIYKDGAMIEDEVVSISRTIYKGLVYDINVDDYRNYIADGLCVHNCLYAFRGSNSAIMGQFTKLYPEAKVIRLKTNYRSCKNLVEQGNTFARYYFGGSDLYADAEAFNKGNGIINRNSFIDVDYQAVYVANKVQQWLEEGVEPNQIAVLYRKNKCSFEIENELKNRNIAYSISGTNSFFNRTESRIFLAILRLIQNTHDDSAIEELMEIRVEPFKYIAKNIVRELIDYASRNDISLFQACNTFPSSNYSVKRNLGTFVQNIKDLIVLHNNGTDLHSLVNKIQRLFKIVSFIEDKYDEQESIDEHLAGMESFKKFIKSNTLDSFLKFVYSDIEQSKKKKKLSKDEICLRTIHASKGLQWRKVILVSVEDGTLPSKNADIVEEACAFYVGVTRAEETFELCEIGTGNTFTDDYFEVEDFM